MKRIAGILLLIVLFALPANANTYTVDNTNDWFWGSLRQAIEDANNHAGLDTIVFKIGSGPKTIRLDSPLPAIRDNVIIDGWTQPGWTGSPIIELDGSKLTNGIGLTVNAPSTIRGLVINRFGLSGIGIGDDFQGHVGNFTVVHGCWIGVGLDGVTPRPNGRDGIRVFANDVTIGGDGPHQRNVIGAAHRNGISIGVEPWGGQRGSSHGHRTRVINNYIGLGANGAASVANTQIGIEVAAGNDNVIGGNTPSQGNVIVNNGGAGVTISSQDLVSRTVIRNNRIGVNAQGTPMGNGGGIVSVAGGSTIEQNTIAHNRSPGVTLRLASGTGITNNSIHTNAGLGIDLAAGSFDTGVTLNDSTDADVGANTLLNFPVLYWVIQAAPHTRVVGAYQGAPNASLSLDFYKNSSCDPSGYGEGEVFLATASITTNSSGAASFDVNVPWAGIGAYVTATARDAGGNTSEFSQCRQSIFGSPVVTNISSAGGRTGKPVTITGSNFTFVNSVKFFDGNDHTVNASFNILGDNTITTSVPAGAKTGTIRVSGGYGTGFSVSFRVTPPKSDFNDDGRADLVWRNYRTGANSIAVTGGSSVALVSVGDLLWQMQGTGDFDNDGHQDIVWRHYGSGDNRIWLMRGTQYVYRDAVLPPVSGAEWEIDTAGDFDGDGDPDLVWRNYAVDTGGIWIMNDATFSGTVHPLPSPGPDWRVEAAGDFNLDGSTDLLWRNYVTGENLIRHMNGPVWDGATSSLPAIPDPSWIVENAVDWDRDGDVDVVWRNVSAGTNVVWLLIGPYWDGASVAVLPAEPDTDMRIEDY